MLAYTVRKPEPNTDKDDQVYYALLEHIGVDLANAPRTLEPGTTNRWLHVWKSQLHAERFARELGRRLRDTSWFVDEFELSHDEIGPLAPLTVLSIPVKGGTVFRLEANSQERVMRHYPNARLVGEFEQPAGVTFPHDVREDFERQHGQVWDQVIILHTGIPEEAIDRLGGVRIVTLTGEVLHERLPANIAL
jgi:hypothetical protein